MVRLSLSCLSSDGGWLSAYCGGVVLSLYENCLVDKIEGGYRKKNGCKRVRSCEFDVMAGSAERKKQNQRQAKAKQKPKASRPVSVRFVLQEQDSIPTVNRPGGYGKPKEPRNAA